MNMEQQIKVKEEYCSEEINPLKSEGFHEASESPVKNDLECNLNEEYEIFDSVKTETDKDKKPISCAECFRTFDYIEQLEVHKTIHDPPFKDKKKCPCCTVCFRSISSYKLHIQKHLITYHRCLLCSQIFFRNRSFMRHVAEHKKKQGLSCQYCGKCFKIRKSLILHLRVHTNERPYTCNYCGKSFKQLNSLSSHKKTVHNQGEPQKCPLCYGSFSTKSSLTRHIKKMHESGKLQVCVTCKKGFANKDLLNQHKIERHSGLSAFYKICRDCNEEFFTYDQYISHPHQGIKQRVESGKKTETTQSSISELGSTKIQKVDCWLCGERVMFNNYPSHKNMHMMLSAEDLIEFTKIGSFNCKKCEKIYISKEELFEHMDSHMEKQYECEKTCGETSLFTYVGLNKHLQKCRPVSLDGGANTGSNKKNKDNASEEEITIPCFLCGTHILKQDYEDHKNEHMELSKDELEICKSIGKFSCKKCNLITNKKFALFIHMRTHLPKTYTCTQGCHFGETKFTYAGLNTHQHDNHKMFVCNICHKNYMGYKNFKKHSQLYHVDSSINKEYRCKWCSAYFNTPQSLTSHYKKHTTDTTAYQCNVCNEQFLKTFDVKAHMFIAHRQNVKLLDCFEQLAVKLATKGPFCSWCKVSFVTRKKLERHENLHKSNKHQCKDCNTVFSKLAAHLSHIRNQSCLKWALEALIPESIQLQCHFCKKSFNHRYLITKHLVLRHMKQVYSCKFCGAGVKLESLRKHLIKNHGSEKKYSCIGCDASFVTLGGYIKHRNCFRGSLLSHRYQMTGDVRDDDDNYDDSSAISNTDSDDSFTELASRDLDTDTGKIEDDFVDFPETVWITDNGELITDASVL